MSAPASSSLGFNCCIRRSVPCLHRIEPPTKWAAGKASSTSTRIFKNPVVSFASCPVLLTRELSGLISSDPLRLWFGRERANRGGGGKVGISRRLRDFQGTVGAVGNLGCGFPPLPPSRLFHRPPARDPSRHGPR